MNFPILCTLLFFRGPCTLLLSWNLQFQRLFIPHKSHLDQLLTVLHPMYYSGHYYKQKFIFFRFIKGRLFVIFLKQIFFFFITIVLFHFYLTSWFGSVFILPTKLNRNIMKTLIKPMSLRL